MGNILNLNEIKDYLSVNKEINSIKLSITPKQAAYLLTHCNTMNRKIKIEHIETLKRDMENGNWYSDIDYIGFNSNGVLINGQHRLKALEEAKVKSIFLKFDFDVEQHVSMDTGAIRKYTDQVAIFKKSDVEILPNKYKLIVTAGLKLVDPKLTLSNTELSQVWKVYHDDFKICDSKNLFNLGPKALTAVKSSLFWAYLSGVSLNTLAQIAKVLRTGVTETEFDIPVIRLRDELVDLRTNNRAFEIKRAEYTQQCIYSVLQGSTNNRLPSNPTMHYQDFPFLEKINKSK